VAFRDDLPEAIALFRRGNVKPYELSALCQKLGIHYKLWGAIQDEWRRSGRMAESQTATGR